MEIKIRKAAKEDCPRLMELIQELADYEKAPDQVTVSLQHFEDSGFGPNRVWWGLAAETSEGIVGFALYYIRYSTWKGQAMYLEDLIITESMRGKGVGKILFDALINEAKEKGFNRLVWQVLDWNEPAINFYKKYNTRFEPEWMNCILNID